MTVELRVLGGARRGTVVRSDKPVVRLGRQADCDVQLDPSDDLEVSARHAEVLLANGAYLVRDAGSTNGTFVNGVRIAGERLLRDGDVIGLGSTGPSVQVQIVGAVPRPRHRGALIATAMLAMGLAVPAVVLWQRREAPAAAAAAPGAALAGDATPAPAALAAPTDFRAAYAASVPAVLYVVTELGGERFGGTAFGVSRDGLLVTNRHLVLRGSARATRVMVKYANETRWRAATVVRTGTAPADDLALLRVPVEGGVAAPVVAGLDTMPPAVGTPVASIGFPLADGIPTDSVDHQSVARASLITGAVSRSLATLLQIDSYAAHGSSGSPVVDAAGRVLGVIYGGPPQANGRIVYAVPAARVAALMKGGVKGDAVW
jgi:S1-C subfamily serine protease